MSLYPPEPHTQQTFHPEPCDVSRVPTASMLYRAQFLAGLFEVFQRRTRMYGPLFRVWAGPIAQINLSRPEHVEVSEHDSLSTAQNIYSKATRSSNTLKLSRRLTKHHVMETYGGVEL
jgi:hypothetical protein